MGSDFNLIPLTQIELVHVIQQQGHTVTVTLPLSLSLAQAGARTHANTNWACL